MIRRVKELSHSRNGFNLLITQEPFKLLPDHLYTLPYRISVLVSVLQRQAKIIQNRNKPPQDIFFPTTGCFQPLLGHTAAVVLKISLQALQLVEILLSLPTLFS